MKEIFSFDEFVAEMTKYENDADKQVLGFIYNFVWNKARNQSEYELVRSMFMNSYCYYFANMLKTAFERGDVYWCAPFGHFVWIDTNGIPYDIEGVSFSEAEYYIPAEYIKEALDDFKHIPGKAFNASKEWIEKTIENYKKEKCLN